MEQASLPSCPNCGLTTDDPYCRACGTALATSRSAPSRYSVHADRLPQVIIVAILGVVVMSGSTMPWVEAQVFFATLSKSGTEGDGIFTFAIGLLCVCLSVYALFVPTRAMYPAIAILVLAMLATGISIFELVEIENDLDDLERETEVSGSAQVASGLYITLIGSIALVPAGSWFTLAMRQRSAVGG